MSSHEPALLEKTGGVATLTLNRPDKLNAMGSTMRAAIDRHLQAVTADAGIRVLLIRAKGRAFCAGADMDDLPGDPLIWRERILLAQRHHRMLATMNAIVVAAVQGKAVGGGASMALAADILLMADDASLSFPFVRIGLVPDGGASMLLQAKLGTAAALDLLLTGGAIGADEASRRGLSRRVVPAAELGAHAQALADELLRLPAEALLLTKSLARQTWTPPMQAALAHEADAFALATALPGYATALAKMLAQRKEKR
ncbi:MAG: enoyl-CoA hydratase/isomerase family protein [Burkholderiaceae bacterium]